MVVCITHTATSTQPNPESCHSFLHLDLVALSRFSLCLLWFGALSHARSAELFMGSPKFPSLDQSMPCDQNPAGTLLRASLGPEMRMRPSPGGKGEGMAFCCLPRVANCKHRLTTANRDLYHWLHRDFAAVVLAVC